MSSDLRPKYARQSSATMCWSFVLMPWIARRSANCALGTLNQDQRQQGAERCLHMAALCPEPRSLECGGRAPLHPQPSQENRRRSPLAAVVPIALRAKASFDPIQAWRGAWLSSPCSGPPLPGGPNPGGSASVVRSQLWVMGCQCCDVRSTPAIPQTAAEFAALQQPTTVGH
jgi:hypothetical protein